MAIETDRAKARRADRQRAVFRELVETQDRMLHRRPSSSTYAAVVACARRAVRDAHYLNDVEMGRIEERGLAEDWPPLGEEMP